MWKRYFPFSHDIKKSQKGTEQTSIYMWLKQRGQGKTQRTNLRLFRTTGTRLVSAYQCNKDLSTCKEVHVGVKHTPWQLLLIRPSVNTNRNILVEANGTSLPLVIWELGWLYSLHRQSKRIQSGLLEGKAKVKYLWETFCAAIQTITCSDWKVHYKHPIYQQGVSYAAADLMVPQPSLDVTVVSTSLKKASLPHTTQVLCKARKKLLLLAM